MTKAYTDIEQSRKLAEILPIESADMHFHYDNDFGELESIPTITEEDDHFVLFPKDVRCWSLAALFGVLPLEIETHKQTDEYKIYYYVESYMKRMGKEIYLSTERHENLVDACYEMILKLHELNLI